MRQLAGSAAALAALVGCRGGAQSALDPAGSQAALIADLWWFLFAICITVFLLVSGFVLYATLRGARAERPAGEPEDRTAARAVVAGICVAVLLLFVILYQSVVTGRAIVHEPGGEPLSIQVIAHQWWWQVRYLGPGSRSWQVETANEIHVPVGRPVELHLDSADVIHSFWVPNLHGKTDLVPGQTNRTRLRADRPGVFRGQCAEFCGLQHAHMAFVVVAEPAAEFEEWLARERRPAAEPPDDRARRGRDVFVSSACVLCHTVRGTDAFGKTAPDLTHVASRRTLAAGTLPNTRGHMAGWILDPQNVKPGNRMPATPLEPGDLHALLGYLESLD